MENTDLIIIECEKAIRTAFADVKYPGDRKIAVNTWDDEGTKAFYTGKQWWDLTCTDIIEYPDALCFLTIEAFHYFLPAILIGTLGEQGHWSLLGQYICWHLTPPPLPGGIMAERDWKRIKKWPIEQTNAISRYFATLALCYPKDYMCQDYQLLSQVYDTLEVHITDEEIVEMEQAKHFAEIYFGMEISDTNHPH